MSIKMKKLEGLIELGQKVLSPDLHLFRQRFLQKKFNGQ